MTPRVEIATETVTVEGGQRVAKFIVTGPQRYRAELPGCLRDECAAGHLAPCVKRPGHIQAVDAWLRHIKTHCHGWHRETVEAFAAELVKPYKPKPCPLPGVTHWMRARNRARGQVFAPCPSWPVVEDKPLPEPCGCDSCAATAALIGAKS